MKKTIKIFLILLITFLVAISCNNTGIGVSTKGGNSGGGGKSTGTITLNLGSSGGRVVYDPSCEHKIILKNLKGEIEEHTLAPGVKTTSITIAAGFWKIIVEAWFPGWMYAKGSEEVEVKIGQKSSAKINMIEYFEVGDEAFGGGQIFYAPKDKDNCPIGFTMKGSDKTFYYMEVDGVGPLDYTGWDFRTSPHPKLIGTETGIGTGMENTKLIVSSSSHPEDDVVAAYLCNIYSYNGFNDWFLPSRDELALLYKNLSISTDSWSSSEHNKDDAYGFFSTSGPGKMTNKHKSISADVYAVRAF